MKGFSDNSKINEERKVEEKFRHTFQQGQSCKDNISTYTNRNDLNLNNISRGENFLAGRFETSNLFNEDISNLMKENFLNNIPNDLFDGELIPKENTIENRENNEYSFQNTEAFDKYANEGLRERLKRKFENKKSKKENEMDIVTELDN